ncbi:multidrug effflux MFS transporter [Nonomuraea dietziae]|uniref:DHA1 family bicyclomycin/chloramphenicol resistance-like MFS transporter n=1 Tax=Nonomuraea dietziae TaxID=65515 RepID=A0A7W5V985_9ACTN|nr:multidrug effflux MFS transporter [Nonomuraea dietziae]MBB3727255.1 DHA1 family bicyclomycin/chloramphenicol resistance-like MFS transporter [Nonomuraea dietziae]
MLLLVLALLSLVGPLATDMYLPAFPRMTEEFGAGAPALQLTLTSMVAGLAVGQLVLGPLSDRYGRRLPLLAGAALACATSALCALAPSLPALTGLRFLQGLSVAAGVVISRAVVSDLADGAAAARMFGILMALTGIGPIVAPPAGALISELYGWRGVYVALAVLAAVSFLGVLLAVPESLPRRRRQAGGVVGSLRSARRMLSDRNYLGYTLAFTFAFGALFCYISASQFVLQNVLGLGVSEASLVFGGGAVIVTLSASANAVLVARVSAERLLAAGLTGLVVSTAAQAGITVAGGLSLPVALTAVVCFSVSLGLVFANATALAVGRVPYAAGAGSAVLGTLQHALAAVVAPLVGLGGDQDAVAMAVGMALMSALALAALGLARSRGHDLVPA